MKLRTKPGLLFVATTMLATGCGAEEAPIDPPATSPRTQATTAAPSPTVAPPPTTTLQAPPPTSPRVQAVLARGEARYTVADVDDALLLDLVDGNTEFALALLRELSGEGDNLVMSPHSIAGALSMAYAGASGETAAQIERTLEMAVQAADYHDARNELTDRITRARSPRPEDDRVPLQLSIVNALWGQRGFGFESDFLDVLSRSYDAGVRLVDFVADPAGATAQINDWVEEETAGRIEDLIPPGALNSDTRVVLTNAIWFKANWLLQFDPSFTADGEFRRLDGSGVVVPLMHGGGRMQYVDGGGFEAARLPYAGEASMLVIAPDDGSFAEFVAGFEGDALARITSGLATHQLDLAMPTYSFESKLSLVPVLRALGITDAFSHPPADFSGISTERDDLFIQDVVHKAFIAVDEEGTEAAAATAVVIGITSAPPPATLTLDRPFVFLIQNDATGEVLFVGQVTDPS